nr:hypothetical protein HmN_000454600 [Hymenolepis microstoma]
MLRTLQWFVLLSIGLVDFVSSINAEDEIALNHMLLEDENIALQCIASGAQSEEYAIRLGCNIRENEICRENCTELCPIINGQRNCSKIRDDEVVGCRYEMLSNSSVKITYELGNATSSPPIKYWCTYRGKVSQGYTRNSVKQPLGRAVAITWSRRRRSASQLQNVEQPNSDSDATRLQMHFTSEVVFVVAICAILSCLVNIICCICCQMSRKYLNRLSKGSSRNHNLENCLCIKSLADTYKPKRIGFKRKGPYGGRDGGTSSALWSQVALPPSFKIPLTEPTPRRKPLSNIAYFPSYHNELLGEPQNSIPDEVVYDDVHQSTIDLNNGESVSQQNLPPDGFLSSVPGTPSSGQKCIVDQNGTVYVAMGHVSQTPRQLRANLAASRVTLTTFQPEPSPKLSHRPQGSQDISIRAGPATIPNLPSVNYMPRKELSGNAQKNSSANQDLMGLPPQMHKKPEEKTASISSGLNPPIPFADHAGNEDEFDDIFDMSKNTLLKIHHNEKLKPLP